MRIIFLLICLLPSSAFTSALDQSFKNPPDHTKPWCYWYWINGGITKEGITKDLEAMDDVGINLAMIGNVTLKDTGPVKMLSPEWMEMTRHAMREAHRLGIDIYMFNGPGWSQSGGPWVKPEQSMRRVTWAEYPASEGAFSKKVRPKDVLASQDIAVLAIPRQPHVEVQGVQQGNQLVFEHKQPFTARALLIEGNVRGKLFAVAPDGQRKLVTEVAASLGNKKTDFIANGYQSFGIKDTQASKFVFEFEPLKARKKGKEPAPKAVLTSEPNVTKVLAKQMARMHPTPAPTWESYIYPASVEPADASILIQQDQVVDLTRYMKADGTLQCTLPEGEWTILYFGMVTTGKKNHPAPPSATGLEVDKMSRQHTRDYFTGMFSDLMQQLSPDERSAFKGITIDSYEVGAQNWTDGFIEEFERRNGYSPLRFLPVFTGRMVDSPKASDQFLWDLRRSVSDMISENYVGGLREIAHENDLKVWCENYGHWGFPGDFLSYGGHSDQVAGEFWVTPADRGTIECRAASSSAHIYGKKRVFAEAFTNRYKPESHPYTFKARGEQLFAEGINHFVLHVYVHQPEDGIPGTNPWFGTPFHRNTPWFNHAQSWVKYLQRSHLMLQAGEPVADVAVYIGDFAPQMIGPANPVPAGYDFDYIGSDAILRTLQVVDGEWVVYDVENPEQISARWKLLAMPKDMHMRPKVRERLEALKRQGGRVIESVRLSQKHLNQAGIAPALSKASGPVRWKERRLDDGHIFFLSNFGKAGAFEAVLRTSGKQPALFNPVTGEITKMARYRSEGEGTHIFLDVKDPSDAFFVVFRDEPVEPHVVEASAPVTQLDLAFDAAGKLVAKSAKAGSFTLKLSDGSQQEVDFDRDAPVLSIEGPWNSLTPTANKYTSRQSTTFELPSSIAEDMRIMLDLGKVNVMAQVTLNGKVFDALWMPPFRVDVTDALKVGRNTLEVEVVSTSTSKPSLGEVKLQGIQRKIIEG